MSNVNGSNFGQATVEFVIDSTTTKLPRLFDKPDVSFLKACCGVEVDLYCPFFESGELLSCRQQQVRRLRSQAVHMGQRSSHFFLRSRPGHVAHQLGCVSLTGRT